MKRLTLLIAVIFAALTLFGTVPCFHLEASAADNSSGSAAGGGSALDVDYEGWPDIDGTSSIVMDAGSGQVLYEKNADEIRDPASITKILNCLVVLDTLDMDEEVTVEIDPETEGSIMELQKGETLTVRDLVYGMMLVSGNDAAEVLAYIAGNGDISGFCRLMNEKAEELGAQHTHYTNPNGLNPAGKENNVTTARDIAIIAVEAMKNPEFAEIVGTAKYTVPKTDKFKERKLKNSNRCLWDTKMKVEINGEKVPVKYDKCIGVKTGYSSTAGDSFAGYVKDGNTEIVTVVLNASHEEEKFRDSINLWNYALERYETYTVETAETEEGANVLDKAKVSGGTLREVDLGLSRDMRITVNRGYDAKNRITTEIKINREKTPAPVQKGDVLGKLVAHDETGTVVATAELVSLENAGVGGPLTAIGIADEDIFLFITAVTGVLVLIVGIILFATRRRK